MKTCYIHSNQKIGEKDWHIVSKIVICLIIIILKKEPEKNEANEIRIK